MQRAPESIVQRAGLRKYTAKNVQKMMIAVLKARLSAERVHASEAGDRGSDPGDFDTESFDTENLCTDSLDDDFDMGAAL